MRVHVQKALNFNLIREVSRVVNEIANIQPTTYKGVYSMHKYWSKKPPNIVAAFIERFSNKGDIVLDPFSGYGVTGIESLHLGRKVVLVDLNPVATFISKVIVSPIDLSLIEKTFRQLKDRVKPFSDSIYKTQCPYCGYPNAIATHYIHCNGAIRKVWFKCARCGIKKGEKKPSTDDLKSRFSYNEIQFWYPKKIKSFDNSRINSKREMSIKEFFTARNLYVISFLYNEIEKIKDSNIQEFFKFVFTAALPQMSNMVFVVKNRGKFNGQEYKPKEEVGSWVIGYWIPNEHFEINVWNCFETRYKKVLKGKKQALQTLGEVNLSQSFSELLANHSSILLKTADATNLDFLPDESVDYIFTDPPHGSRIPYFELSSLWASWLKMNIDFEKEIVISDAKERNKDLHDYINRLYLAFKEMHRVLKPGKFLSVAFNNLDDKTWLAFIDVLTSSGFEILNVYPVRYSAGSVVQDNRKGGLKSDFVFTCVKKKRPIKSFIYNSVIESKENVRSYVIDAISKLKENSSSETKIYSILNEVIPRLISEKKVFKISDVVEISRKAIQEVNK